ncbi:hypothetical protein M5K25_021214 [Dendrobium thyrsiflorum]|uniref:Odorant receptor n=1 Tax=Dendrobium thyrsiflorum TaxID=117978 RepID=A0ABD0UIV3_DENTH
MKLLKYFSSIENAFASEHFMALYELLSGISKNVINLEMLEKATRSRSISDPTTIQMLFEISKGLHDSIDILNEDYQQKSLLICYFVRMVSFGDDRERHLTFLATCRAAFSYFDMVMDTVVLLSNNLASGAIKGTSKFSNFVKACVAFSEATIPSIPSQIRCMKLFIATAEVALFAGLFSHTKGLLNSAIDCLLCLDLPGSYKSIIEDEILPLTCKMCSILAFIPGINGGIAQIQMRLMLVFGHNEMFIFGDESYEQEISLVTKDALQCLFKAIEQDPASASKGKLALEACNCLIINFKANHELHLQCSKLIEIATSCLHSKDNYLKTSVNFFEKHFQNL